MNARKVALDAAIGLPVGALIAFFTVGPAVFADGPADKLDPEYLAAYGLASAAFAIASVLAHAWRPRPWHGPLLWFLALPLIVAVTLGEPPWTAAVLAVAAAWTGATTGWWAGNRLAARRTR